MTTQDPGQQIAQQQPGDMGQQHAAAMQQQAASAQQLTPEQIAHLQQQDPLFQLRRELSANRERFKQYIAKGVQGGRIPNGSELHAVFLEIDGTVLSFMETILQAVHATRDHLFHQIVANDQNAREAFGEVFARLESVEDPDTQFTQEDAAKFVYVCQAAQRLAEICRDNPKNDRKELDKILATAKECLEILDDATMVEEPEAAAAARNAGQA